jgi:hypothetical protein
MITNFQSRIGGAVYCVMIAALLSGNSRAHTDDQQVRQGQPHEVPAIHPYVPPIEGRDTSPGYRYSASSITTVQVNVNASGQNIVGDAANEPSMAVDPTDPNSMVIGWRQFNSISSDFRQAGWGYTANGGTSWTFPGVIEPGIFRSDPVLDSDANGNFYYNSLTVNGGNYTCDVFKSTNGGATWDLGTYAYGGDKQWMTIDKTGLIGSGNVYAYWTQSFSSCSPGYFTRSVDDGVTYQSCITVTGNPFWGTLSVGPDGELYVCGSGFVVTKSTTAQNPSSGVTWDLSRTVSLDGTMSSFRSGSPNPGGLLGQAWIAVDRSSGPTRGYVYLLCSVDRTSNSDPLDVMFSRSTDGGSTWSAPIRVNDDAGTTAYQWFGTMSVAPSGRIDAVWYDTRDNPGSVTSALYYSSSTDGGLTWAANEKLSESFNPLIGWPIQQKIGDYIHMVSDDTGARLAWSATFNGEQDVYYSYITPEGSSSIPCADISRFQARCRTGGTIQAKVLMTNTSHTGEIITVTVDGNPYAAEIGANGRAVVTVSGLTIGPHTVELTDPPGCFDPVVAQCTADLAMEGEDWNDSAVSGTKALALLGNYPDPFNPSTTIRYVLPENVSVTLRVYNMLGQIVRTLVDGEQVAGEYSILWDGRNEAGSTVSSGVYLTRLTAGDVVLTERMLFTK